MCEITRAIKTMKIELLEELQPMIVGSVKAQIKPHTSSLETKNLINDIKENCTKTTGSFHLNQTMMQKDIKQILKLIEEDKIWKKEFEDDIKKNYAKKWVEKALSTVAWLVIGSVVAGLLALVLKS